MVRRRVGVKSVYCVIFFMVFVLLDICDVGLVFIKMDKEWKYKGKR